MIDEFEEIKETDGNDFVVCKYDGLTKREYFAAMAMQGLLLNDPDNRDISNLAVREADSLIKKLNGENDEN